MGLENRALVETTVTVYRRFWTALLQTAEPMWSQLDLTILQLKGLILLEVRREMTVGSIADTLAVGRPSASVLVEQLVQLGFAMRIEDSLDRRRALVSLTAEGKGLAARLHQGDERFMQSMFAQLSDEDLLALTRGLNVLAGALEAPVKVIDE